jgi:hypothetical protein
MFSKRTLDGATALLKNFVVFLDIGWHSGTGSSKQPDIKIFEFFFHPKY